MTTQQAFALALQHHQAGRLADAEALYRQILTAQPNHADALHYLGLVAHQVGRHDVAIELIRRAVTLNPNDAGAHSDLGEAFRMMGRVDETIASYRRTIELGSESPELHNNLGNALSEKGQFTEAVVAYRRVLELKPDYPQTYNNLGNTLRSLGRLDEAIATYRRALQLKSDLPEAWTNLGNALRDLGQIDEAIASFHRALQLRPDSYNNLGNALKEQGQLDEALAAFRRALEFAPEDAAVHSNFVYTLHFHPRQDERMIAEEQHRWSQHFAEPLRKLHQPWTNDRNPERRLRIGYVSPNFHRHPICHFVLPLLEAHDEARVESYCYASVKRPDDFTERVKKTADVWRDVIGLGDQALAEQIRADRIDILVDLTQHMATNRLLVFARKPAPIQVAWLGYPASTGLPTMDYRFTDRFMEPEGAAWSTSVETPICLPDCWFCFDPIESPELSTPPALQGGQITFGCLNNFCKVNEAVLRVWARVLQAVDGSRLLLHCPAGATQTRVRQSFKAQGVADHRLELVSRTATRVEYLQFFQRIDIALDPFPYNGGTTTCEALWMGIPVVSLEGRTAVSRLGFSVLTNLGLPELAANSEDSYVVIAAQLAHDLPRLAELRRTLRARMQASPLMDAPRFARNMEAAYRTMWEQWCEEQRAGPA